MLNNFRLGRLQRLANLINLNRRARLENFSVQIVDVCANGLRCEMRRADAFGVDDLSVIDRHDSGRQKLLDCRCSFNQRNFLLLLITRVELVAFSAAHIDGFALFRVECNCRRHHIGFRLESTDDDRVIANVVRRVVSVSCEVSRWTRECSSCFDLLWCA